MTTKTDTIPHINLIICTPGHSMMATYVKSLLSTLERLSQEGITWAWSSEYSSHVGDAREMTLNGGNENDPAEQRPFKGQITYDKLLWIDSDITFTPEDVLKAYRSDKDITTGAYLLASGEATVYKEIFKSAYTFEEILALDEPVQVGAAGMGFMCVKSGIFEKLSRPWFQSPIASTTMNDGYVFTFPVMGEDVSFCKRATDLGFELWLDPSIRLIHNKMMKLTWEGPRP